MDGNVLEGTASVAATLALADLVRAQGERIAKLEKQAKYWEDSFGWYTSAAESAGVVFRNHEEITAEIPALRAMKAALVESAVPLEALHCVEAHKSLLGRDINAQIDKAVVAIRKALSVEGTTRDGKA